MIRLFGPARICTALETNIDHTVVSEPLGVLRRCRRQRNRVVEANDAWASSIAHNMHSRLTAKIITTYFSTTRSRSASACQPDTPWDTSSATGEIALNWRISSVRTLFVEQKRRRGGRNGCVRNSASGEGTCARACVTRGSHQDLLQVMPKEIRNLSSSKISHCPCKYFTTGD